MASPAASTLGKTGRFGDLKRRLLFLLGAMVVYRVGAHIPVPGIDPVRLADLFQGQQGGILGIFNLFSGGALSRFTIFALDTMFGANPGMRRAGLLRAMKGHILAEASIVGHSTKK